MSRGLRPWAERLAEQELASGTVVGDAVFLSPDYRVDPGLSRYTRSFAFRAHPFETRRNYATDLTLWLEFLWRRSKGWREATSRDLDDFEFWRRLAPQNPVRVGGSKWNRERAAITGLYRWAVREGLVRVSPTAGRQAAGRARDARPSNVHWLTPRTWKLWADIGPAAALPTAGRCMAGRAGWRTATRCLSSCSPRRVCAGRWPRRC
ncbi:site-specific integrase [Streptomyces olindensis]|uniref:site-specific integrase n=1 Tax=Streptomyces olindensis TaxID=358823 RepID=UPI003660F570